MPVESLSRCQCRRCLEQRDEKVEVFEDFFLTIAATRFIVCAKCGNKRCPHATDHRLECTNSNEPGQPGSAYE